MKAPDIMNGLRLRPVSYRLNLSRVSRHPCRRDNEPQKNYAIGEKGTFLDISIQVSLAKGRANLFEVVTVLLLSFTIDEDIIKVDNEKFTHERPKSLCHYPHEGTRRIT